MNTEAVDILRTWIVANIPAKDNSTFNTTGDAVILSQGPSEGVTEAKDTNNCTITVSDCIFLGIFLLPPIADSIGYKYQDYFSSKMVQPPWKWRYHWTIKRKAFILETIRDTLPCAVQTKTKQKLFSFFGRGFWFWLWLYSYSDGSQNMKSVKTWNRFLFFFIFRVLGPWSVPALFLAPEAAVPCLP